MGRSSVQQVLSKYTAWGPSFYHDTAKDSLFANAPHPLLIPPTLGYGVMEDFHRFSEDEWTITVVEVGTGNSTIAMKDSEGGVVRVNTAANENDGAQAQQDGEAVKFTGTEHMWFEARVNLTDEVTESDAFVGFSITDTTIIASAPDDIVYFHKDDGDTNWDFTARLSGTSTNNNAIATATAATWIHLGWYWDGTEFTVYVDGVPDSTTVASVPDQEMQFSFGYLNGAGTAQNEGMDIDWYRLVVIKDRS